MSSNTLLLWRSCRGTTDEVPWPEARFTICALMNPTPLTYARAKRMRREPTAAEAKLWGALRNRSLGGFKFYRQVPIGPYIVDFINYEWGVVVEVNLHWRRESFAKYNSFLVFPS